MGELTARDGAQIIYEKHGSGTPLIMLHGLSMNLAAFYPIIKEIEDQFMIYAMDSRGHGKSSKPIEITIEDHVNDIIDLMEHENIDKAHILGHDMGGVVAQELAIRNPEKVNKLVLVSSISNKGKQPLIKLIAKHKDKVAGFSKDEAVLILFNEIFHNEHETFKWYQTVKQYYRMNIEEDAVSVRTINGINVKSDLIQVPTFIIKGKYDPLVSDDGTEKINHAKTEIFEHSGHAPFVEEKEKFKSLLLSYLKKKS